MKNNYLLDQKMKFNKEKQNWIFGILIWAICFLAIQVMQDIFIWLHWAGIILNLIIIVLTARGYKGMTESINKLKKEIKDGKK